MGATPLWNGEGRVRSLLTQAVWPRQVEVAEVSQTAVSRGKERAVRTREGEAQREHTSSRVL